METHRCGHKVLGVGLRFSTLVRFRIRSLLVRDPEPVRNLVSKEPTLAREAIARWLYALDRRLLLHGTQDCFRGPGEEGIGANPSTVSSNRCLAASAWPTLRSNSAYRRTARLHRRR